MDSCVQFGATPHIGGAAPYDGSYVADLNVNRCADRRSAVAVAHRRTRTCRCLQLSRDRIIQIRFRQRQSDLNMTADPPDITDCRKRLVSLLCKPVVQCTPPSSAATSGMLMNDGGNHLSYGA